MDNRDEVNAFLSSRRAKITPEQAGLVAYGRNRRVPGLRRSEVADLAGVSVEYYSSSSGAISPASPRACSTRSAGLCISARPSGRTCLISPAPPALRAAPAAGPRPGRSGPASFASWTV